MPKTVVATAGVVLVLIVGSVSARAAEVCEYTPSKLLGKTATAGAGAGGAVIAAAGVGMKAAGYYAIQNAVTGAWMLGSTAAGASAAGIAGILAGTAGAIGTAGAAIMSVPVIIAGTAVAAGVVVYESGCYLAKK